MWTLGWKVEKLGVSPGPEKFSVEAVRCDRAFQGDFGLTRHLGESQTSTGVVKKLVCVHYCLDPEVSSFYVERYGRPRMSVGREGERAEQISTENSQPPFNEFRLSIFSHRVFSHLGLLVTLTSFHTCDPDPTLGNEREKKKIEVVSCRLFLRRNRTVGFS